MIHSKLEEIRKSKKISKKAMAQKLGISITNLNLWESGKSEIPLDMLCSVAKVLNMSVDAFLKYESMMPEEAKNNLRRKMILAVRTDGMDDAAKLAQKALLDYPEDNTLKLMIATVLFLGESTNRNNDWLNYAVELLDSIDDWNEDFMRSVIYTKAMILNFLNDNKRCEEELNKIDWNILDPYPLYAKVYRQQREILKQKKLASKRLYHHLNMACLMLEELSFSFEEPQKAEFLYLEGQLSRMFGLSYYNAFLALCDSQLQKGNFEEAKNLLIEYLESLSKVQNNMVAQAISSFNQRNYTNHEEQIMIQKSLNELKEDIRFRGLIEDEKIKEIIQNLIID